MNIEQGTISALPSTFKYRFGDKLRYPLSGWGE